MKKEQLQNSGVISIKITEGLIYTTLFLLPILYFPGFIFSYTVSKFVFLGFMSLLMGGFSAWTFFRYPTLVRILIKNRLFLFGIVLYLSLFFLSVFTSIRPEFSFWSSFERGTGGITMLFLFIFSIAIYSTCLLRQNFLKTALYFSVSGALLFVISIIISTDGIGNFFSDSHGGGLIGNSSLAGAYVLWNIFFALVLFVREKNKKLKFITGTAFILMILCPLFLNWAIFQSGEQVHTIVSIVGSARGAVFGLIYGLITAGGVYLFWSKNKKIKYTGLLLLLAVTALTIFVCFKLFNSESYIYSKFVEIASDSRFTFADISFKAFHEHPYLGWGPENFSIPFHAYFDPDIILSSQTVEVIADRPHNIIFEQMINGGTALIVGFLLFIVSIVIGCWKAFRAGSLSRAQASMLIGGIIAWFIQNQFVFDSIASLMSLFLIAGLTMALSSTVVIPIEAKSYNYSKKRSIITKSVILAVTFVLVFYFTLLPGSKAKAMYDMYNLPIAERVDRWERLKTKSPMGNVVDIGYLTNKIYDHYRSNISEIKNLETEQKNQYIQDIDATISYLKFYNNEENRFANEYRNILLISKYYMLKLFIISSLSDTDMIDAQKYAKWAIDLSPSDPEAYWVLAQFYFTTKEIPLAKDILEKAVTIEPKIGATYDLMLNLAIATKDEKYYYETLTRAQIAIPDFVRNTDNDKK